jgi:hypothetical protein
VVILSEGFVREVMLVQLNASLFRQFKESRLSDTTIKMSVKLDFRKFPYPLDGGKVHRAGYSYACLVVEGNFAWIGTTWPVDVLCTIPVVEVNFTMIIHYRYI